MFRNTKSRLTPTLASLLALGALGACSTATPYQPVTSQSPRATGYDSQRLAEGVYRVSFAGNSLTSRQTVENYLLYRAAEVTLENGYEGFVLVERDTEREVTTRVDRFGPGRFGGWGPSWGYYRRGIGWSYWDPYYGDPFWHDNIDVTTVDSYEAFAEIAMYRGARPANARAFNAREVLESLGPTIQRP